MDKSRCVVTTDVRHDQFTWSNGRLSIDGAFQLDAVTSHIYHEVLVSLPLLFAEAPVKDILILGGGDGCAAAEALKFNPECVTIADWNKRLVEFCADNLEVRELNHGAYDDPRVYVVCGDAFEYVAKQDSGRFDAIIMDFTGTDGTARIDSREFHTQVNRILIDGGVWSRVLDFPVRHLPWWIEEPRTLIFDVDYPLDRIGRDVPMGESFIMRLPDYAHEVTITSKLSKMQYLTQRHVQAVFRMRRANRADEIARAEFASA